MPFIKREKSSTIINTDDVCSINKSDFEINEFHIEFHSSFTSSFTCWRYDKKEERDLAFEKILNIINPIII